MLYRLMQEADVEAIAGLYMDYYNRHEDGCWSYDKACRRIRQMVTIQDALCLIQQDDEGRTTGFAIGYFKEYDDLTAYYLEEIVILAEWQNRGFGKQLLQEIERRVLERGAKHIELISVNDGHHLHFYKGFGMHEATNLRLMAKHFD